LGGTENRVIPDHRICRGRGQLNPQCSSRIGMEFTDGPSDGKTVESL
jgi:hypothetical protein